MIGMSANVWLTVINFQIGLEIALFSKLKHFRAIVLRKILQ